MNATIRMSATAQRMVRIQYAHGQVDFQIMKEATNGPRYGDRTMKQDQMLILRLSFVLV